MNDILDSWSSPWRTFHKTLAAAVPHTQWKPDPAPGADSWLRQARAAAQTGKRQDPATIR